MTYTPPVRYRHTLSFVSYADKPSVEGERVGEQEIHSLFFAEPVAHYGGTYTTSLRFPEATITYEGQTVEYTREEVCATPAELPIGSVVKVTREVVRLDHEGDNDCGDPDCCGIEPYKYLVKGLYVKQAKKTAFWRAVVRLDTEELPDRLTEAQMAEENWEFVRHLSDDL